MPSSGSSMGSASIVTACEPLLAQTSHGLVEYAAYGEGPAMLALHGGMGGYDQGLILARAALGATNSTFRVLSVSRPGYLGTPLDARVSPQMQADLYAALLDRLGISTAFVVAVSAGGPSALEFALRHPSCCAGLILISACTGHLEVPREVTSRLPFIKLLARMPWLAAFVRWNAERNPARSAAHSIRDKALLTRTFAHPEAGPLARELQSSGLTSLARRLPGTLNDMAQLSSMASIPVEGMERPMLVIHGPRSRV